MHLFQSHLIQQSVKTGLHKQVVVFCLLNLNQNLRIAGILRCLLREEWRQSHPTWICCSQQEKIRRIQRRLQPQKTRFWGFIHTTSTWHEGPSKTCTGASSSRCGNTRLKDQPDQHTGEMAAAVSQSPGPGRPTGFQGRSQQH